MIKNRDVCIGLLIADWNREDMIAIKMCFVLLVVHQTRVTTRSLNVIITRARSRCVTEARTVSVK